MRKILIHIMLRSQHPVTVSIPCALPNLSMNYYASVKTCIILHTLFHFTCSIFYIRLLHLFIFRFDYYFTLKNLLFFQYISTVFSYMAFVRIMMDQE